MLQRGRHSHHCKLLIMNPGDAVKQCLALFPLSNMVVGSINISHIHKSAKLSKLSKRCSSLQISQLIGLSQQIIKMCSTVSNVSLRAPVKIKREELTQGQFYSKPAGGAVSLAGGHSPVTKKYTVQL